MLHALLCVHQRAASHTRTHRGTPDRCLFDRRRLVDSLACPMGCGRAEGGREANKHVGARLLLFAASACAHCMAHCCITIDRRA